MLCRLKMCRLNSQVGVSALQRKISVTSPSGVQGTALGMVNRVVKNLEVCADEKKWPEFVQNWKTLMMFKHQTSSWIPRSLNQRYIVQLKEILSELEPEDLADVLKGLRFHPDVINLPSEVHNFRTLEKNLIESLVNDLNDTLKTLCLTSIYCTGIERLQLRTKFAKLWTIIDRKCSPGSLTSCVVRILLEEGSFQSRRTFSRINPDQFADLSYIVAQTRSLGHSAHGYYMIFKSYDILCKMDCKNLPILFYALTKHNLRTCFDHPLNAYFRRRLMQTLVDNDITNLKHLEKVIGYLDVMGISYEKAENRFPWVENICNKLSQMNFNILVALCPVTYSLENVPYNYKSILLSHLSHLSEDMDVYSCSHLKILLISSWLSNDLKEALAVQILKSVTRSVDRSKVVNLNIAQIAGFLGRKGYFDEELLKLIYSDTKLFSITDGRRIFSRKFYYTDDAKKINMVNELRNLASHVEVFFPMYNGPLLDISPYKCFKPTEELNWMSFINLSSKIKALLDSMLGDKFICETCLIRHTNTVDFIFAIKQCGEAQEFDDDTLAELRDPPRDLKLSTDLKWFAVALSKERGSRHKDRESYHRLEEAYKQFSVSALLVKYFSWNHLSLEEAAIPLGKSLLKFVQESRSKEFMPGYKIMTIPENYRKPKSFIDPKEYDFDENSHSL